MIRVDDDQDYNGRERKQILGREGWYVEKYDQIDKFTRLDKTCKAVDLLCVGQFLKMFEAAHKMKEKEESNENQEVSEDEYVDE